MRNVKLAALFVALTLLTACSNSNADWERMYNETPTHSADASSVMDN